MYAFIVKRLLSALVTLFAVMTLVFVLVRIVPGDPAQVVLGDQASREAIEAMQVRLGLDRPMWEQYVDFLTSALQGDWGTSMVTGQPVLGEVLKVLPWTIELTLVSLVLGAVIGIPLGVWAAIRRNRFTDYVTRVLSLLGLSFPAFVSAIMLLLVFSIQMRWFPVISSGGDGGFVDRMRKPRAACGQSRTDHGRLHHPCDPLGHARGAGRGLRPHRPRQGVPQGAVLWRHALRNALIPVVTVVGLYLGILIGNSVLTESRVQPPRPRQADRRRAEPARLHHVAGDDGDLHLRGRDRESGSPT